MQFTTIYPGWYSGRTVHIHVRVRTYSGSTQLDQFTAQLFFDDTITDQVFTQTPYNTRRTRDTRNSNDMVLTGTSGGTLLYLELTPTSLGYAAAASLGVNLKAAATPKPVIAAGGVVNAASYQAGVAPGALIAIFGQNLAATARGLTSSDLASGSLPTTLGGVSVQIDNRPAFLYYVSPGQINAQAPADSNFGTVPVTGTNAGGTSDPVGVNLQNVLPAFFTSQNYAATMRSDGTLVMAAATKPGDIVELYGTGFGPTDPDVSPGAVFSGSAPLANPAAVTIGGLDANVSYAGLVGAGIYRISAAVPAVADGDHEVIAQVAGIRTQPGVLLTTKSTVTEPIRSY